MCTAFTPTVSATLLFQPGFEANQSTWFGQNLKQVKELALAHGTSTRAVLVLRAGSRRWLCPAGFNDKQGGAVSVDFPCPFSPRMAISPGPIASKATST